MKAGRNILRLPLALGALASVLLAGMPSALHAEASATDAAARLAGLESAKGTARFSDAFASALEAAATVEELVDLVDRFASALADPAARQEAWARAAATLELAGRFDEAAERHGKAAAALPGKTDAASLIAAAACWLQAGECERALAMAELAALSTTDPNLDWRSALVVAWAGVCGSDPEQARSTLEQLRAAASDPARKSSVLLLEWALASGSARASLAAALAKDYPGSPEALVASGAVPVSPFWYLAFPRPAAAAKASTESGPSGPSRPSPSPSPSPGPSPGSTTSVPPAPTAAASAPTAVEGPRAYQVGLFAERTNAERLAASLDAKGFDTVLESRDRPGSASALAVLVPVPAGTDPAALLLRLKDAGFEAWPVF